jgi:hypothetical protein
MREHAVSFVIHGAGRRDRRVAPNSILSVTVAA